MDDITRRLERERMLRARIDAFDGETQSAWSLWYDLRHLALVRVYANDTPEATQLLILAGKVKDTEDLRAPARKCDLDRATEPRTWARYASELQLASDRARAGDIDEGARLFVEIARARAWEEPTLGLLDYLLALVRFLWSDSAGYGDAELAARAAFALASERHSSPHPETLRTLDYLKTSLVLERKRPEVTAVQERIVRMSEEIYGQTDPLAEALFSLGYAYRHDGGQYQRALDVTRKGFAIVERLSGADSGRTAWMRATLAGALSRCGLIDEAIAELERSYRKLSSQSYFGDDLPATTVRRELDRLRAQKAPGATQ